MKFLSHGFSFVSDFRFCWQERPKGNEALIEKVADPEAEKNPTEVLDDYLSNLDAKFRQKSAKFTELKDEYERLYGVLDFAVNKKDEAERFLRSKLRSMRPNKNGEKKLQNFKGKYERLNIEQKQSIAQLMQPFLLLGNPVLDLDDFNNVDGIKSIDLIKDFILKNNFNWNLYNKITEKIAATGLGDFKQIRLVVNFLNKSTAAHQKTADCLLGFIDNNLLRLKSFLELLGNKNSFENFLETDKEKVLRNLEIVAENFPGFERELFSFDFDSIDQLKDNLLFLNTVNVDQISVLKNLMPAKGKNKGLLLKEIAKSYKDNKDLIDNDILISPYSPIIEEGISNLRLAGWNTEIKSSNYDESIFLFFANADKDLLSILKCGIYYEEGGTYRERSLSIAPTNLENFYFLFQRVLEQEPSVLDAYKKIALDTELIKAIAHPMMFVNDPEFIVWAVENRDEFLAQQTTINKDDTGFTLKEEVFTDEKKLYRLLAEVNWIGNHSPANMKILLSQDIFLSTMKENCPNKGFHLLKVLDVMNCALDLLDDKQLSNPKDVQEVVSFVLTLQESDVELLDENTWVAHLYGSDEMFNVRSYQKIYEKSGVPEHKILCDAKWSENEDNPRKSAIKKFANVIKNLPEALLNDETQTLAVIFSVHGNSGSMAGVTPNTVANLLLDAGAKTKGIIGRMKIITHSCGGYDFMNEVVCILKKKQLFSESLPKIVYTTAENDNYGVGVLRLPKELRTAAKQPASYKTWNESAQKILEDLNNDTRGFSEKFSENFFAAEENGYLNRTGFNNPTWKMQVTEDVRALAKRKISNKKILRKIKVGQMIYFSNVDNQSDKNNSGRVV